VKPWLADGRHDEALGIGSNGRYHASFLDKGGPQSAILTAFDTWYGSGGPAGAFSKTDLVANKSPLTDSNGISHTRRC